MNKKLVVAPVILVLLISFFSFILFIGCAKQTNPVSAFGQDMPKLGTVMTRGSAEWACVYNDTIYAADNQAGVTRIILDPPQYISNYSPGLATLGIVWVGYDSAKQVVVGSDRDNTFNTTQSPASLNRLLGKLYKPIADTMSLWQGFEVRNSGSTFLFHDPDTTLHLMKCHLLGDGFRIYTGVWALTGTPPVWTYQMSSPAVGYNPPNLSVVRQAVITNVNGDYYAFAAAEDYGFVSISIPNLQTSIPTEVGHVDLPGYSNWVARRDSFCYVATKWSGIGVISVTDPTHPRLLTVVPVPNSDEQLQIEVPSDGSRLFLVDNLHGIYVFSLANPRNPVYMGLLPHLRAVSVCCYEKNHVNYLIVCAEAEGVTVYRW